MDELTESNDIQDDWQALRDRFRRDGYVFLRALIDPGRACQAGADALAALLAAGWVDADGHPVGPVRQPGLTDPGFRGFGQAESVNRLPYEPGPERLMRLLAGQGVFVYPVKIPRAVYPDRLGPHHLARFVHQDYRVFGTQDMFTMWLPLHDIPIEMGPLAVRPGSSRLGWPKGERLAPRAPGWASTHFRPGDALVFHCLTWHAALPNQSDRLRLSIDVRWQLAQDPVPSRVLNGRRGPERTGGGELLGRRFGRSHWWHPVPDGLQVVEATAPPVGGPIAPSRYVDFPARLRQPAARARH